MPDLLPRAEFDELIYKFLKDVQHFERMDQARFKLSWRDMYFMKYLLNNSGCRISEVAQEMDIPLFTASRMVQSLEKKGYVLKEKDDSDQRNIHVHLTDDGREVIQSIKDFHYEIVSANFAEFSESEQQALLLAVGNLSRILQVKE